MAKPFNGTRRQFLQMGLTALACGVATPALASIPHMSLKGVRSLAFHNLHTDERLHIDYWNGASYDRTALAKINHILRDHYSGDVYPIHVRLIDLLYDLKQHLHNDKPVEIISGYRSPKTNAMLSRRSEGVAKHSYHTKGMAMDIRMQDTSLRRLQTEALFMHRGGVGYYPESDFVHIDVGPARHWQFG